VGEISVIRAAHVIDLIRFFEEIGTPVERELAKAGLPTMIEDFPEAGVNMHFVEQFRENCRKIEKIENLGWLLHQKSNIADLSPYFKSHLHGCSTLFEVLRLRERSVYFENNFVRSRMMIVGDRCHFVYNAPWGFKAEMDAAKGEWHRLMACITVVRYVVGPTWLPERINFRSTFSVPDTAREAFAGTQIRVGQSSTSFSFPAELLAVSCPLRSGSQSDRSMALPHKGPDWVAGNGSDAFVSSLRSMLKPYLCEFRPSSAFAAEVACTSKRSLQRKLWQNGLSYSHLLDQCLFELASPLLANSKNKIIDVALSVGYDDPSHFSRAFHRISGLSPSSYRAAVLEGCMVDSLENTGDLAVPVQPGGQSRWQGSRV
jgi:AraC-like DNA-binding protein